MEQPERGARSRYERAVERGRQRDRANDRTWMAQHLSEPFDSFLVEQLAWGAVGFALGLLLGSRTLAVLNAVVFTGTGLVGRAWVRRRYQRDAAQEQRSGRRQVGAVQHPAADVPQRHGHHPAVAVDADVPEEL